MEGSGCGCYVFWVLGGLNFVVAELVGEEEDRGVGLWRRLLWRSGGCLGFFGRVSPGLFLGRKKRGLRGGLMVF